jgi:hypothetical protein
MSQKVVDKVADKRCAPINKFEDGSCYTLESLQKIATAFNAQDKNKNNKINISNDKNELLNQLTKKISECQSCWLRTELVKNINDDNINETFRPVGPEGKKEWLSTTDINDVVEQYQEKYKDFVFLGAVPYDFMELKMLGIQDINLDGLVKDGKTKIGLVINLDEHNQDGSHWVALFANLKNKEIYFFDSVGDKPGKKIKWFINVLTDYIYNKETKENNSLQVGGIMKIINKIKNKQVKQKYMSILENKLSGIDIRYNQKQHQFKDSECGVYSINFIVRLAGGETFDEITNNITKDDKMNECRETYFRNVVINK